MLVRLTREPFDSANHLFELKWDGDRVIAFVQERIGRINGVLRRCKVRGSPAMRLGLRRRVARRGGRLPAVQEVAFSGEPDVVDDRGKSDGCEVADDEAKEEGSRFVVERDAADAQNDDLRTPRDEDAEGIELGVFGTTHRRRIPDAD